MSNFTKKIKCVTILTLIFLFTIGNVDFAYAKKKSGWDHVNLWAEAAVTALGGKLVTSWVKALDYGKVAKTIYENGWRVFTGVCTGNKTYCEDNTGVGWAIWGDY